MDLKTIIQIIFLFLVLIILFGSNYLFRKLDLYVNYDRNDEIKSLADKYNLKYKKVKRYFFGFLGYDCNIIEGEIKTKKIKIYDQYGTPYDYTAIFEKDIPGTTFVYIDGKKILPDGKYKILDVNEIKAFLENV